MTTKLVDLPPGSAPDDNDYSRTFISLKARYEQFTSALDCFLGECTNFGSMFQQRDARRWSELEKTLVDIDSTITSLRACCSRIRHAEAVLGTARNRSMSLVPFNKLPTELVVHILSFANTECIIGSPYTDNPRDNQPPFLSCISATSRRLRDIAAGASGLWTHVDLLIDRMPKDGWRLYGQDCLRYSERLPLNIHVVQDTPSINCSVLDLASFLGPHMHRIASLNLHLAAPFVREFLLALSNNPSCLQAKELHINDIECDIYSPNPELYDRYFDGLEKLLKPLEVLTMCGPCAPLTSAVFRGLTVLKLSPAVSGATPPTLRQLTDVLTACQELRSLALIGGFVRDASRPIQVVLPKLEALDVRLNYREALLSVLSCIIPASGALAFTISLDSTLPSRDIVLIRRFIDMAKVTRLCIDSLIDDGRLDWLLGSPATKPWAIRELALLGYNNQQEPVKRPLDAKHFPYLYTVHLMVCDVDHVWCRQALESSSVQSLQIDERSSVLKEVRGLVPYVQRHKYSTLCYNDGHTEWPLYQTA